MNSNQYPTTKQNGTLLIRFLCAGALLCTVTAPDLSYANDPTLDLMLTPQEMVRQQHQEQIAEKTTGSESTKEEIKKSTQDPLIIDTNIPPVSMRYFMKEMNDIGRDNGVVKVPEGAPNVTLTQIKRNSLKFRTKWQNPPLKAKQVGLPFPGGKYEDPEGNLSLMLGNGPLPGTGKIHIPGKKIDGVIKKGFEVKKGNQTYTIFPISNKFDRKYSENVDAVMVCESIKDGVGECVVHQIPGSTAGSTAIVNESLTAFEHSNAHNDVTLHFSKDEEEPIVQIGTDTTVYTRQSTVKQILTAGETEPSQQQTHQSYNYRDSTYDQTGGSGLQLSTK